MSTRSSGSFSKSGGARPKSFLGKLMMSADAKLEAYLSVINDPATDAAARKKAMQQVRDLAEKVDPAQLQKIGVTESMVEILKVGDAQECMLATFVIQLMVKTDDLAVRTLANPELLHLLTELLMKSLNNRVSDVAAVTVQRCLTSFNSLSGFELSQGLLLTRDVFASLETALASKDPVDSTPALKCYSTLVLSNSAESVSKLMGANAQDLVQKLAFNPNSSAEVKKMCVALMERFKTMPKAELKVGQLDSMAE